MRALLLLLLAALILVRADLSVPRYNLAAAGLNNYLIFAGGLYAVDTSYDGTNSFSTVDLYDSIFNQWSSFPMIGNISSPSSSLTAGALDSGFLIAGGTDGTSPLANADYFDTSARTFTVYPPLALGRSDLAGASTMGVAAFGGGITSNGFTAALSIWDSRIGGGWNDTLSLATARVDHAAAAAGHYIVFAGGFAGTSFLGVAEVLDVNSMTLTVTSGLVKARARLAGAGAGRYFVFAGGYDLTGVLSNADLYDTQAGTWSSSIAPLTVARSDLAAATVGTKLLFAGGKTADGYTNVVEVFDTATLSWVVSSKVLAVPRSEIAAASASTFAVFAGGIASVMPFVLHILNEAGALATSDMFTMDDLSSTTTAAVAATTNAAAGTVTTDTIFSTSATSDVSATVTSTINSGDVTVTASTAASFGTTSVATITATTAATATTGNIPPPPTSGPTYTVEGNEELPDSWTAPKTTIFEGDALASLPRLQVAGTAFLGGTAQLDFHSPITEPIKVRLVGAGQLIGTFKHVKVSAPKAPDTGHCYKYSVATVKPYTTVYTVNIVPRKVDCPNTHLGWLIFAIVFGSICLLALVIFLIIYFVKTRSKVYVKT